MKILSKTKILIVFVALFAISLLQPFISHAQIQDSPGRNNVFSIVPADVNKILNNCSVSSAGGLVGSILNSGQVIISTPFDDIACICDSVDFNNCRNPEAGAMMREYMDKNKGIAGVVSTVNASILDQRPASGVQFIEEKVYALSNPGKVYAADNPRSYYPGAGTELLRPIQAFWGWSVNFVFGFLILLIIIIAFAIMFRQRLGGAAEVTIQNSIPNIALAMILVPLSYAITGLFIDGITIGTNAAHDFLLGPNAPGRSVYENRDNGPANANTPDCTDTSIPSASLPTNCDRGYYADDPLIDVWRSRDRIDLRDAGAQIGEGVNNLFQNAPTAQAVFNFIGALIKILPGDENQSSEFAWFGNVINIIIGILTIWIALKIFIRLIKKFLALTVLPIFSPFIFATAALPGNGIKSVIQYLKMLGACTLTYIVTYVMFLLTLIFTDPVFINSLPDYRTSGYIPPLLGIQDILKSLAESASGAPITQLIATLIGIGIYFSIPNVLDSIDDTLGTKFMLPQFVKTPFENMAESFKITTRAFPAAAARATQITAGTGFRTAQAARNTGFNIQRAMDKARGWDDNDPRSAAFKRKQGNIARRQQLLADLDAADGQPVRRAQIQAALARLDTAEALQGAGFSTKTEEGKDRAITTEVQYLNANDLGAIRYNFMKIDQNEVKELMSPAFISRESGNVKYYSNIGGTLYLKRTIAKLVIKPENMQFPGSVIVNFAGVEKNADDGVERYKMGLEEYTEWDNSSDIFKSDYRDSNYKPAGMEYGNSDKVSAAGTEFFLRAGGGPQTQNQPVEAGKKVELLIDLYLNTTIPFTKFFADGSGYFARGVQTPKRAVKIGAYTKVFGRISIGIGTR